MKLQVSKAVLFVLSLSQLSTVCHGRRLIVGGDEISSGKYPYFVDVNGECGGVLIARNVVLSTAVCNARRLEGKLVTIAADSRETNYLDAPFPFTRRRNLQEGESDWNELEPAPVVRTIVEHAVHPDSVFADFDFAEGDDLYAYDFSLLLLDEDVILNTPIELVLHQGTVVEGEPQTVMGVGETEDWCDPFGEVELDTAEGDPDTVVECFSGSNLKEITIGALDDEFCAYLYEDIPDFFLDVRNADDVDTRCFVTGLFDSTSSYCAGADNLREDATCYGDMGGPAVRIDGTTHTLTGLLSLSGACGDFGCACDPGILPDIYARVSAGYDWIVQQVCGTWGILDANFCEPVTDIYRDSFTEDPFLFDIDFPSAIGFDVFGRESVHSGTTGKSFMLRRNGSMENSKNYSIRNKGFSEIQFRFHYIARNLEMGDKFYVDVSWNKRVVTSGPDEGTPLYTPQTVREFENGVDFVSDEDEWNSGFASWPVDDRFKFVRIRIRVEFGSTDDSKFLFIDDAILQGYTAAMM